MSNFATESSLDKSSFQNKVELEITTAICIREFQLKNIIYEHSFYYKRDIQNLQTSSHELLNLQAVKL